MEARFADPAADEHRRHQARQNPMASGPRLQAEMAWLIDVPPCRVQAIMAALSRHDLDV